MTEGRAGNGAGPPLHEQVALVTGGVRGIGRAICEDFVRLGVRVAAGYSRNEAAAQELQEALGEAVTVHRGNIADHEDCERVVEEVIDRYGRLDIVVNNAGITVDKSVRRMTPAEWDHVIEVNLNGAFYISRAALPHLVERIPLKRLGQPEEIARMVTFLADPASGYITGQIFSINGGLNM